MRAPQYNGNGKRRGKMRFVSGVAVNDSQRQAKPWLVGRAGFVQRDVAPASQGWLGRNDYRRTYAHKPSKHGSLPRTILAGESRFKVAAEDTMWGRPQPKKP